MKCTHQEMLEKMLLQIFYRILYQINKFILDSATGGSFVKSSYGVISSVLDQVDSLAMG